MNTTDTAQHLAETPVSKGWSAEGKETRKLTTRQAAEARGVAYTTIMAWINYACVKLPAERVSHPRGDYYLIEEKDLMAYKPNPRGWNLKQRPVTEQMPQS